ncbi:roadblock/LC7 domain-containing protein [Streptomyces sp. NPDC051018]|uniref:roadblock/LC7 domain-containing protein n=1 Tax=Streptomyces sp. NPDC051018 TaxID=3365639 RepID=UPI0037AC99CC
MQRRADELADELSDLGWLLDGFVTATTGVEWAVLTTRDGLARSCFGLLRDHADVIGALASGLHSLGESAPEVLGACARIRQTVLEYDGCWLFVVGAGKGTLLAVRAAASADPGVIGHEMGQLVKSVGEHLVTPDRSPSGTESVR